MKLQVKTSQTSTCGTAAAMPHSSSRPDPEVLEKKPRRQFSGKYKLKILSEIDACEKPGEIGAILRREGLYHSNISVWQRQREQGILQGLTPLKRGRKNKEVNPLARRVAELEGEIKQLTAKLKKAETIIDVQKKISEILGISQPVSHGGNS